jgi:NitT/TauT family transport system ATP-binding protein
VVDARGLSFSYSSSRMVIPSLTLTVSMNECFALMGPSGCGKTTFVRLVAGLLTPRSGSLTVAASSVSYLQQGDGLLPWLSVLENVALPLVIAGRPKKDSGRTALTAIESVFLSDAARYYPHQLSGGMKKRVEIARAITSGSKLWLLDEPFESLDVPTRQEMVSLIRREMGSAGATVILVTHGIEDALSIATRVAILNRHGRLRRVLDLPNPTPRDLSAPCVEEARAAILKLMLADDGDSGRLQE